jgi:riboflavin kinase/FMN adenylyltransferase
LKLIKPEAAPEILTCKRHKLRLLEHQRLEGCILLPFDDMLRNMEAHSFINNICSSLPQLCHIVTGSNWTFGRGAKGNTDLLEKLTEKYSIGTTIVPPVEWRDAPISSTRIRQAVRNGDLETAEAMLGHPFSMLGDVIHGRRIGHDLGYPTANIDPHNEVHPPSGVYAARCRLDKHYYDAAAYIGSRPTFEDHTEWVVEVYLLNQHIDLYGREAEVFFLSKVREDRRFAGTGELQLQIQRDVEITQRILKEKGQA